MIFTHDLDFGSILAATKADCPSVIQVRTQDVTPKYLSRLVVSALHQFEKHLEDGALITVAEKKLRARILLYKREALPRARTGRCTQKLSPFFTLNAQTV